MKEQMTIGKKLMLSVASLLVLMMVLSYASLNAIADLGSDLDVTVNQTAKKVELAGHMQKSVAMMRWAVRSFMLSAVLKDQADYAKTSAAFDKHAEDLATVAAQVKPMLVTDRGRAAVAKIEAGLKE